LMIAASVVMALVFYTIYTSTIILWDAYGLEVTQTESSDPESTITVTYADLGDYPLVESTLETVRGNDSTIITYKDGDTINQFSALVDAKGGDLDHGYVYLSLDGDEYLVAYTIYGGMKDEPVYLALTGLSTLMAVALTLKEIFSHLRGTLKMPCDL